MKIGAHYRPGVCHFSVWAPLARKLALKIVAPGEHSYPMTPMARGYWKASIPGITPGTRYLYDFGEEGAFPDPASHYQPEGVHGPSEVIDHASFQWVDGGWRGLDLERAVIYELHVGTFTPDGTFEAIIPRLGELAALGVTAVEIMPVAQFSGARNWGYDGTFVFAPQNTYGGPVGLKSLVNACHARGIAVILDAVFNHTGPEGSVLHRYAPYFTDRCATPWGQSVNYDGAFSDDVRNYVVRNMAYWFWHYHIDALRLDAIQHIYDGGARHILREMAEKAGILSRLLKRRVWLIGESDLNDVRVINHPSAGGYGLDAQWLDDFHHSVHALLTGETTGYYADYGGVSHLAKAIEEGFVYSWTYSRARKKHYGSRSCLIPPHRFVICIQNHDQIGNRMLGERLSTLVPFAALTLAAGLLFSMPYIPLLFMGEEYGERAPFLYFVSHSDPALARAVGEGRKNEFRAFGWRSVPPDPQDAATFEASRIGWEAGQSGEGALMKDYYAALIRQRARCAALFGGARGELSILVADEAAKIIVFSRRNNGNVVLTCANFAPRAGEVRLDDASLPLLPRVIDSAQVRWRGGGEAAPEIVRGRAAFRLNGYEFAVYSNAATGSA